MNHMNLMKHAEGLERMREKNKVFGLFFSFFRVWNAVFGSFSFIKFIILVMRHEIERHYSIFMNYMKIYEEGVFMAFFCKAAFLSDKTLRL